MTSVLRIAVLATIVVGMPITAAASGDPVLKRKAEEDKAFSHLQDIMDSLNDPTLSEASCSYPKIRAISDNLQNVKLQVEESLSILADLLPGRLVVRGIRLILISDEKRDYFHRNFRSKGKK